MIWIISGAVAAVAVAAAVTVFLLFYFGLINNYHPMKRAKRGQIKIACVGDSITYGCMVRNRGRNNYPAVLGRLLGEKYCVNNFGYTNRTLIKSGDFPYIKEKTYRQSLEFEPDAVVFMLGSNDSKANNWDREKFIADFKEILASYLALDSVRKLYVLVPPPVFEVGGKVLFGLRKDVLDGEICPLVKEIAEKAGAECVDIHALFEGRGELFADGIHPNAEGSKLIAKRVYEAFTINSNLT